MIGLSIFNFSASTEQILTKLTRKQFVKAKLNKQINIKPKLKQGIG